MFLIGEQLLRLKTRTLEIVTHLTTSKSFNDPLDAVSPDMVNKREIRDGRGCFLCVLAEKLLCRPQNLFGVAFGAGDFPAGGDFSIGGNEIGGADDTHIGFAIV